jgi:hypothetical protein
VLAPPENDPGFGNSDALGRKSLVCARLFSGRRASTAPMAKCRDLSPLRMSDTGRIRRICRI